MADATGQNALQVPATTTQPPALRVLALDGGGIRGLSSLYILERLMYRLKPEPDPKKRLKPCEVFDVIAGTSTGGLIALMLGRLEMDVDSCIKSYTDMAKEIFTPRKRTLFGGKRLQQLFGSAAFSAETLEAKVKELVRTRLPRREAFSLTGMQVGKQEGVEQDQETHKEVKKKKKLLEDAPLVPDYEQNCKVFVCSTLKNGSALRLRTYHSAFTPALPCTIWQAARATSAAPTFFDPISLGNIVTLHDGGLRNNNPIQELIDEIRVEFSGRDVCCIISIGTGIKATEFFKNDLISIAKSCVNIATDTALTESNFRRNYASQGQQYEKKYFRFEVEQGMQETGLEEWRHMNRIWGLTDAYLTDEKRREALGDCASLLQRAHLATGAAEHQWSAS